MPSTITTMFARYYNAVEKALGSDNLQVALGSQTIAGTNNQDIWRQYNQAPKESLVGSPTNAQFSSSYGSVINRLTNTAGQGLDRALGDKKDAFRRFMIKYSKDNPKDPLPTPSTVYTWALTEMSPGQATLVQTEYSNTLQDPVAKGVRLYADAEAGNEGSFPWQVTQSQVAQAVQGGQNIKIEANYRTDSDISNSWAGKIGVSYGYVFEGSGSAYESWTRQVSESFSIEANYYGVATVSAPPLFEPYPEFEYMYWFDSATLGIAANQPDKWKNPNDYGAYFGPGGSFLYQIPSVIFCRSFDITLTAKVSLSEDEKTRFKASVEAGTWPFYVKASGEFNSSVTFNENDEVKIEMKSGDAGIYVLGYVVEQTKS